MTDEGEIHLHDAVAITKTPLAAIVQSHHDVIDDALVPEKEKVLIVMCLPAPRDEMTIVIVIVMKIGIESEKEIMMIGDTKNIMMMMTVGAIVDATALMITGRTDATTIVEMIVKTGTMSDIIKKASGTRKTTTGRRNGIGNARETETTIDTLMKARGVQNEIRRTRSTGVSTIPPDFVILIVLTCKAYSSAAHTQSRDAYDEQIKTSASGTPSHYKPRTQLSQSASSAAILEWLHELRLHKYADNLKHLSWKEMISLNDDELEKLGVSTQGARSKLLKVSIAKSSSDMNKELSHAQAFELEKDKMRR